MGKKIPSVLWFSDVDKDDIALVGGKGANLGEMVQAKFPVPDGFIVSSQAYFQLVRKNNLTTKINQLLSTVHFDRADSLMQVSQHIKKLIMQAEVPEELIREIFIAYKHLGGGIFKNPVVAVRSSATTEDLKLASFAGQQETFLNVHGEANLLLRIRETWASLFEQRLIFYRHQQNFDHFRIGTAVIVQKMIESEKSGVMFTLDPVTNDKSKLIIEAIYGLGELIAQGEITPDHYEVTKADLTIIKRSVVKQKVLLEKAGNKNKEVKVPSKEAEKQKITDNQIIDLAILGKKLEEHYYFPQDIEWAIENNKIYIVQTRAITTTHTCNCASDEECALLTAKLQLVLKGSPASPGIASGPVKILNSAKDIAKILPGDVLVVPQTNPDFVGTMKKAAAMITDNGGRTSHAAIVCRELGIPIVVGTGDATKKLQPGLVVTVNGTTGEVYNGANVPTQAHPEQKPHIPLKTATRVYAALTGPDKIQDLVEGTIDGVGLLNTDYILKEIGLHPKKLLSDGKQKLYIDKFVERVSTVCKVVQPHPVMYQASSLTTTEYSQLAGGHDLEAHDPYPLLGLRGASRYLHDPEIFSLELEAIKKLRTKSNLNNIGLMLPFVRSVKELMNVKKVINAAGLHRSPTFKVWIQIDVPANVLLLDNFIEVGVDGISINADDLTSLILGVDRHNSSVSKEFNELDPAVLWAFEHVIKKAHKHHLPVSVTGQSPTISHLLLEKLIHWGITSVTIPPENVDQVRKDIHEFERKLIEEKVHKKH